MPAEDPDLATKLLLARLDTQDRVLDRVLTEVKRTNGRVTTLEQTAVVASALSDATHVAESARRGRWSFTVQIVTMLVAGGAGAAGHGLGLW